MAQSSAQQSRQLVQRALKGSLGTLDCDTGAPYVSLVAVAADSDGTPVLLLSGLARHTRNALGDARASLLLDGTDVSGDPVTGARLTLMGQLEKTSSASARERFLASHPGAAQYADFSDFAFWRLEIAAGHFIGGFGRIVSLAATDLILPR